MQDCSDLVAICPSIAKGHIYKVFNHLKSSDLLEHFEERPTTSASDDDTDTDVAEDNEQSSSLLSSCSVSTSDCHEMEEDIPNLVSARPSPKEFPIEECNFGYNGKEIIRTGLLTEVGKREITTEIIRVMKKFER